ncbi:CapA family protein [Leucobacter luti]|uniref:CapA family protein n=1 Tax=Leucobacter luti TaxID=340320 RepID=UPI001C68F309|nr:CapA family protein [Leucobacter luti]QYM75934.1 CapA family protein [Leucobacter luti]
MTALTQRPVPVSAMTALTGAGICAVALSEVVARVYSQVDWRSSLPIPAIWQAIGATAGAVGIPLLFLLAGALSARLLACSWNVVLRGTIARLLGMYLVWTMIRMLALIPFPEALPGAQSGGPAGFPPDDAVARFFGALAGAPGAWILVALAGSLVLARALRGARSWIVRAVAGGMVAMGVFLAVDGLAGNSTGWSSRGAAFGTADGSENTAVTLLALGAFVLGSRCAPLLRGAAGEAILPSAVASSRPQRALGWIGSNGVAVWGVSVPVFALLDASVVSWLSNARMAVQLVAAGVAPVLFAAVVVSVGGVFGTLARRDRIAWLCELPWLTPAQASSPDVRQLSGHPPRPARADQPPTQRAVRAPWRIIAATLALILFGSISARGAEIPLSASNVLQLPASRAGSVSIGATGDLLIYDARHEVPEDDGASYFARVRPWFTEDLVMGNLEQTITDDTGVRKCSGISDCLAFRSAPSAAAHFAGFDLLNLANNHSRDFGAAGYDATKEHLAAAGIRTTGDRDEITIAQVGGIKVAILGFAPYDEFNRVTDLRRVQQIVRSASAAADIVIVQAHMGAEGRGADVVRPGAEYMYGERRGDVTAFSRAAIDAGADLVLGHGPHVLRGMEVYRGRLIAYSLGNFGGGGVFGRDETTRYGVYLSVQLRQDGSMAGAEARSVRFEYAGGAPIPDPAATAAHLMNKRSIRDFSDSAAVIAADGSITFPPR